MFSNFRDEWFDEFERGRVKMTALSQPSPHEVLTDANVYVAVGTTLPALVLDEKLDVLLFVHADFSANVIISLFQTSQV